MTLLWMIETHLYRTATPPSRFGRNALNDPRLVRDLRHGRMPGADTERRLRAYIARVEAGVRP